MPNLGMEGAMNLVQENGKMCINFIISAYYEVTLPDMCS